MTTPTPGPVITYDATVVTGLEYLAIKECNQKLSPVGEIGHSVGHVFIPTRDPYSVLSTLHSVDNIYVVIYDKRDLNFVDATSEQVKDSFTKMIDECDWQLGLQVWAEANHFTKCDVTTMLDGQPDNESTPVKPSFRITCNRTGTQKFTSQEASSIFGGIVNDRFHWPVSLKKFDFEILLTLKDKSLRVSICLSKESLFKRYVVSYGVTTLRGTIAYNLVQIAELQPGDLVCDPLCGTGVIPIETELGWPGSFVLAADNHAVAIEKTLDNLNANRRGRSDLAQWDSTRLPLRSASVDVFVTDLPFGKRIGSKHQNRSLYPALFAEMIRCVRPSTGRIVLLTQDKSTANKCFSTDQVRRYCKLDRSFYVKIGGLDASIYLLRRNGTPFEEKTS